MLEELEVGDLGVIESATLEFDPALTVITGETGAGKTMLLTALGLLLGARGEGALVRHGAERSHVSATFALPGDHEALAAALEAGARVEDGVLLAARAVAATGRSRCWLGGRPVPLGILSEVTSRLVTVHGQSDQLRLRSAAQQRAVLDAFAGPEHLAALAEHRRIWAERADAAAALADFHRRASERAREAADLRQSLELIERVGPAQGEDTDLLAAVDRLAHAEELREAAALAHAALSESPDELEGRTAIGLLEAARRALEAVQDADPAVGDLAERIAEMGYLAADVATDLAGYLDALDADPAALAAAQQRRADLSVLTRRWGPTVDDVLAWSSQASLRLLDLDRGDDRAAELTEELTALDEHLGELADRVSAGRQAAARELTQAVAAELAGLAMSGSRFGVELTPSPGPWGAEQVEFTLAPHPDAPPRPLARAASGGEMSRIMLAIEVVLAPRQASEDLTFVFDEVDAGVGGRAAVEIGRRLARLARRNQVVVVTHLAQVAAFADRHLVVARQEADDAVAGGAFGASTSEGGAPAGGASADGVSQGGASESGASARGGASDAAARSHPVVASGVGAVQGEERVRELARMLSGQEDSAAARTHAAELLALAAEDRA